MTGAARLGAVLIVGVSSSNSAHAETFFCPEPRSVPKAMGITTRYVASRTDPTQSTLDPKKVAEQRTIRSAINQPVARIISLSDKYRATGNIEVAKCLAKHFATLADTRAFESVRGDADNFYRSWMISSLAIAYLKAARTIDHMPPASRIHAWFSRNATAIQRFHEERARAGRINNHYYWGGVAVTAVAQVTGNRSFLAFGRHVVAVGLSEVDDQGMLSAELKRGKLARHYHLFAAQPLAAIALLGRFALTREEEHSMIRLASALADAFEHPTGGRLASTALATQTDDRQLGRLLLLKPFVRNDAQLARRIERLVQKQSNYDFFLGGKSDFLLSASPNSQLPRRSNPPPKAGRPA